MLNWIPWTKNDFKVSQRMQVNAPSNIKLAKSLMDVECQPCGIFEGFSYYQEDEAIDTTIFVGTVGLGYRLKKLVSSNFMDTVISVSVIFDTVANYSCSSNKGEFLKLEEKMFPSNLKGMAKGHRIFGFGIV